MKKLLPALVIAGALTLAYFPLVSGQGIIITDDVFTSDITNGEWPARVEMGRHVREGHLPVWTRALMGGLPLLPAGLGTDPLGLTLFALLPPVPAINALLLIMMLIAGIGAATLTRELGATLAGAAFAGLGFVFSGYVVSHLKHTGIISTVMWIPWGCWLLLRAFSTPPTQSAARPLAWFALVFGLQLLAGFVQSAHLSALWYGAWAAYLAWKHRGGATRVMLAKRYGGFVLAGVVGACIGAVQLLPTFELTQLSDRSTGVTYEWVTRLNYDLPNLWMFVDPYHNGDFGDGTYTGSGVFWEDYSYTGLVTLLFAVVALRWFREKWIVFWWLGAVVALLVVLGKHTPVFTLFFNVVPGMKFFRFPTRFLVLVHLALSVLGGLGLSHLQRAVRARWPDLRALRTVGWLVVGLSFADLQYFQLRQNPIADAARWMATPDSARFLQEHLGDYRAFTLYSGQAHTRGSRIAKGWLDLEPFYQLRDVLQPDSNLLWGIPMADGYVGLMTKGTSNLWGGGQVKSQVHGLEYLALQQPELLPELMRVLRTLSVKYVIAPLPQPTLGQPLKLGYAYLYELESPAPRFHLARRSRGAMTNEDAFAMMRTPEFEPGADVIIMDVESAPVNLALPTDATLTLQREDSMSSELLVTSSADVVLVNTETFFKNWVAEIDGKPVEIQRANINHRAVKVPAGTHQVRFFWRSPMLRVAITVTLTAFALALAVALWRRRPAVAASA